MTRYKIIPAPEGQRYCPRCRTVKPSTDFEPARKRPCGLSQGCHACLSADRSAAAYLRRMMAEGYRRQFEQPAAPAFELPDELDLAPEAATADHYRQLDASRRQQRLQRRK